MLQRPLKGWYLQDGDKSVTVYVASVFKELLYNHGVGCSIKGKKTYTYSLPRYVALLKLSLDHSQIRAPEVFQKRCVFVFSVFGRLLICSLQWKAPKGAVLGDATLTSGPASRHPDVRGFGRGWCLAGVWSLSVLPSTGTKQYSLLGLSWGWNEVLGCKDGQERPPGLS